MHKLDELATYYYTRLDKGPPKGQYLGHTEQCWGRNLVCWGQIFVCEHIGEASSSVSSRYGPPQKNR